MSRRHDTSARVSGKLRLGMSASDQHMKREVWTPYQLKPGQLSSHGRVVSALEHLGTACRILDVGTATGYLGAVLRRRGFKHVCGIEEQASWAAEARPFYETLVTRDIERDPLPWPPGTFDVMICADVLEHVRHPDITLQHLLPLLTPEGYLIISLPNIAHWSVRISLLLGRFEYAANGILDRDHLRFFTRRSARRLLHQAGLRIQREEHVPLPMTRWCNGSWLSLMWQCGERLDWGLGCLSPTLFAYQFVFVARRPAAVTSGDRS